MKRRRFFSSAVGEAAALFDRARGIPQCRLSGLETLPWDRMRSIVPRVAEGVRIHPEGDWIRATVPGKEEPLDLFRWNAIELRLFNRMDGSRRLDVISEQFGEEFELSLDRSTADVRAFFLRMVKLGVCVPRHPIQG